MKKEIPLGSTITPTKVNFKTSSYNSDNPSYIGGDGLSIEIGVKGNSSQTSFDVYSFFHGGSIKWTDENSNQWLYSLPNKSGTLALLSDIPDAYTKTEADGKYVPYTGASKDVDLGNHSFTMSSVFTVGSESSVYTQTTPGSISLKNPIGTLSIGISSLGVNGTTIYWPTVSGDPNGKYLALRSDIPDTSTLLDKGTSSTVVNQVVYNPVEMKKVLKVPSIRGENSGNNYMNGAPLYSLGSTMANEGGQATGSSSLELTGYTGATGNPRITTITQKASGDFVIAPAS